MPPGFKAAGKVCHLPLGPAGTEMCYNTKNLHSLITRPHTLVKNSKEQSKLFLKKQDVLVCGDCLRINRTICEKSSITEQKRPEKNFKFFPH